MKSVVTNHYKQYLRYNKNKKGNTNDLVYDTNDIFYNANRIYTIQMKNNYTIQM